MRSSVTGQLPAECTFPGEADLRALSARAAGVDVEWAHGHWNLQGEWQTFVFPYRAIPTFREQAGYLEAKRVLNARWYLAARSGYTHANASGTLANFELAGGLRANRFQTIKFGYGLYRQSGDSARYDNKATIQLVSTVQLFSRARQ